MTPSESSEAKSVEVSPGGTQADHARPTNVNGKECKLVQVSASETPPALQPPMQLGLDLSVYIRIFIYIPMHTSNRLYIGIAVGLEDQIWVSLA